MMQTTINNIFSENKFKLKNLGQNFLLADFQKINVHPSLKKYILAAIDDQLFTDISRMRRHSKFDYKGEKIERYFGLISEEIKNNREFSISYISEMLKNSAEFNANLLSQPNHTLINFIFENKKQKPKKEIISKLQYIYYYQYISKIILTYLDKKQIDNLSRKGFAFLLKKIDEISKKTDIQNLINITINSMADYFNQTNESFPKIPITAIQSFLEEKELTDFVQRLELKYEFDQPKYLSVIELKNLFELVDNQANNSTEMNSDVEEIIENVEENQFINVAENNEENNISIVDNTEQKDYDTEIINEDESNGTIAVTENSSDELQPEIQYEENLTETSVETTNEVENDETQKVDEVKANDIQADIDENLVEPSEENIEASEIQNKETSDQNFTEASVTEKSSLENDTELEESKSVLQKPDVKKIIRKLVNITSVYNSLFKRLFPFASNDLLKDITLNNSIDAAEYKFDRSTLSEDFIALIPEDEEYIGVVEKDNNGEDSEDIYNQKGIAENDVQVQTMTDNEINLEVEQSLDEYDKKNIFEDESSNEINLDINDTIDDIINDESYEQEFKSDIDEVSLNKIDNDEIQEMTNLIDEDKLKLIEDEKGEVTEVFPDLTYLDDENEIENNDIEVINNYNQHEDDNLDYEKNNDYGTDVKVVFRTFQEMLLKKEMTNIIETIFDYDMEDYYKIIRTISNSSNENEGIEITDSYCRNNHIDTFHEDVMEFKNYISDYFSQSD